MVEQTLITKQQLKNAINKGWGLIEIVNSIESKHGYQSFYFYIWLSDEYTKLKEGKR